MAKWTYLALFVWLISCAPTTIHFSNPEGFDEAYQNFIILNFKTSDNKSSEAGNALIETIEGALASEMTQRGYTAIERGKPDMLLRYELVASRRTRTDVNRLPYSNYAQINNRVIQESALLIELTNASERKLIWQGSLDLRQYSKKHKAQEAIKKAVAKIFETYPFQQPQGN